jgi:hypothetical protein
MSKKRLTKQEIFERVKKVVDENKSKGSKQATKRNSR